MRARAAASRATLQAVISKSALSQPETRRPEESGAWSRSGVPPGTDSDCSPLTAVTPSKRTRSPAQPCFRLLTSRSRRPGPGRGRSRRERGRGRWRRPRGGRSEAGDRAWESPSSPDYGRRGAKVTLRCRVLLLEPFHALVLSVCPTTSSLDCFPEFMIHRTGSGLVPERTASPDSARSTLSVLPEVHVVRQLVGVDVLGGK